MDPGARWNIEPWVARPPPKPCRFHDALEPVAPALTDHVDLVTGLEDRDEDLLAFLRRLTRALERELPPDPRGRDVGPLVVTRHGLGHLRRLVLDETQL